MSNHVGQQLGDYKILEPIGSGGMGEVYLAEHVHLRKKYALKILPEGLAQDRNFVARFHDEARVMAELRHEHIVQVHTMGCEDGVYFLVMDYVTGPEGKPLSLHEQLKKQEDGRLPESQVRKWAIQIAEALAYAHDSGVVHRDLKPANILIDANGDAKLTDFGLAKAIGSEFILSQIHTTMQQSLGSRPTRRSPQRDEAQDTLDAAVTIPEGGSSGGRRTGSASSILGTYDYMAPEQRGEGTGQIDQRTDIYSFGVVLYRLLTGKRPTGFAKAPSQSVLGISKRWDAILPYCIADEPSERYASAEALLADLRMVGRTGLRRMLVGAAAVTFVAVVGWLAVSWLGSNPLETGLGTPMVSDRVVAPSRQMQEAEPPPVVVDPNQQKFDRFEQLIAEAQECTTYANRAAGLTAVREALLLLPDDPEALAEQGRIGDIEAPAVVAEREKRQRYEQLIATAKGCTTYADRERGLAAIQKALAVYPGDAHALAERERLQALESSQQRAERQRREQVDRLLREARANDSKADGHTALAALEKLLTLHAGHAEALRLKRKIEGYYVLPKTITVDLGGGVTMELVLIPAGSFMLGSKLSPAEVVSRYGGQEAWYKEHPQHSVRISKPFYMAAHEVTVGQFRRFMEATGYVTDAEKDGNAFGDHDGRWQLIDGLNWRSPGYSQTDDHPVACVSWNDATAFSQWLSRREGREYRLPTEAEWEYACRGGTTSVFWWGDEMDKTGRVANVRDTGHFGASEGFKNMPMDDGYMYTSPVGQYRTNGYRLYDMIGNVWEWCQDWYGSDYYGKKVATDPTGPGSGQHRVLRGGGWHSTADLCRAAARSRSTPDDRHLNLGFRCALGTP